MVGWSLPFLSKEAWIFLTDKNLIKSNNMTPTKSRVVENLLAADIFSRGQAAEIINTLFELIKQSPQEGEPVLISGFGKFSVKEKHQKRCRNPQKGNPITLLPGKVVNFKWSGILREKINDKVHLGLRIPSPSRSGKIKSIEGRHIPANQPGR
jgi:integration host factor subunit alpha